MIREAFNSQRPSRRSVRNRKMRFHNNLSKITNFVFVFGICPYKFNRTTNQFECSALSLNHTIAYFLATSTALIYVSVGYYLKDGIKVTSILSFLKFTTVMTIFCSTFINLLLNRKIHANFLNKLLKLECNLTKLNVKLNHDYLLWLHRQHISILVISATFYVVDGIIERNEMTLSGGLWYVMHFFQTATLTLVTYYIRCIAIILHQACKSVLEHIDNKIRKDLMRTKCNPAKIVELMNCFKAFDELTNLKQQLSKIFGVLLLLTSADDFTVVTIAVYDLLYYLNQFKVVNLFYFAAYSLPHIIKCVLLVESLDTLADQV